MNAILVCLLTASAVDVDVKTLAEDQVSGRLVQLTSESVVIATPDRKVTLSTLNLLSVTLKKDSRKPLPALITVRLVDGSVVLAETYAVADSIATVNLVGGGQMRIPTRAIDSVLLKPFDDLPELQQQWDALRSRELLGDTIVTRTVTEADPEKNIPASTSLKTHDGVLFDITPDTVSFKLDEQMIPVRREKVEGILYYHPAGRKIPKTICRVIDIDGSTWNVKTLHTNKDALNFVTAAGAAASLSLDRVRKLDFSVGKIVYLSDIKPESVKWSPFFGSPTTSKSLRQVYYPQMDKAFSGGPLKLFSSRKFDDGLIKSSEKEFPKGLAIHSRTLLSYRLPDKYAHFIAKAGIDPQVREGGNVRLKITGDGKTLFDGTLTGKDPEPLDLDLDITGVGRLRILVDFGDGTDIADFLHLCNAKVTK